MRKIFAISLALATGGLLFAQSQSTASFAPGDSPALAGASTNGETIIYSDKGFDAYYKLKTIIYRENVRVFNPQMKLTCELLTVESPELPEGKFNRVTAETNVVIDWVDDNGTNHATADKAVYTYSLTNLAKAPELRWQTNSLVVLSGHPYVTNKIGTWNSDPIIWDRIRAVISAPSLSKSSINPTNSSKMFGTEPPKTNSTPK